MNVILQDLPEAVKGMSVCVAEPEGDFFTIVLNSKLAEDVRAKALEHEKNHIKMGHFHDERPLSVKEHEAEPQTP